MYHLEEISHLLKVHLHWRSSFLCSYPSICSSLFLSPNNRLLIFNLMKRSRHMDLLTFNPSFQSDDLQICKNHRDLTNSMKILSSYPYINFNGKLIICLHSNCGVKFGSFKTRRCRECHLSFKMGVYFEGRLKI